MTTCIFPHVESAIRRGHQATPFDQKFQRGQSRPKQSKAKSRPVRVKPESDAEKFRRLAEARNRIEVDKAVAALSDAPEPHPELTAQTIHGCRVFFCEDDGPPRTVNEIWTTIAGGVYA